MDDDIAISPEGISVDPKKMYKAGGPVGGIKGSFRPGVIGSSCLGPGLMNVSIGHLEPAKSIELFVEGSRKKDVWGEEGA